MRNVLERGRSVAMAVLGVRAENATRSVQLGKKTVDQRSEVDLDRSRLLVRVDGRAAPLERLGAGGCFGSSSDGSGEWGDGYLCDV